MLVRSGLLRMYPADRRDNWHAGQSRWSDVAASDWNDWHWQLRNRITTLAQLETLLELSPQERAGCLFAAHKLALAITPHFFNLIDPQDPNCPVRRQVIPHIDESVVAPGESSDPVGEEGTMPVPGIVHRYPDRVLFLVTDRCASYCRYCTRSRLVSNAQSYDFHPELEQGLQYIAAHPEVRDVLISGGDPLLLSDAKIDALLGRLRAIPHVEFIRMGSRIPVFLPQRITPELAAIFRKHGPIWMSIHTNHPKEITRELAEACERLSLAGVPLGNQSVLLNGINDTPEIMKSLVHRLLMMRVRPYYLYACDLIEGSTHFRAPIQKGIDIIRALRGHTTGYGVPQLTIDGPGGGGKIPINPEYVQAIHDGIVELRNFEDRAYIYPSGNQMPEPKPEFRE